MRFKQRSDAEKALRFLELEELCDLHNLKQMTKVDVLGLTKGKIAEMKKLPARYKREREALKKKIKQQIKSNEGPKGWWPWIGQEAKWIPTTQPVNEMIKHIS